MSAPEPGSGADRGTDLATTIEQLSDPALSSSQRRGLVRQLSRRIRPSSGSRLARWRPRAAAQWAVEALSEIVPHVPVRELETLSRHHGGLLGDPLAERLIRNAARATAGVGAASGGLAAVQWAAPPTLLTAPVLLSAETVAIVAIEVKLVGELHAVHQVDLPGSGAKRAVALLQSWAGRRGITSIPPTIGAGTVLGAAARKELADRLVRRFGTNLTTLAPVLVGAGVAAYLNRRATRALGEQLRADLVGTGAARG